MKKDLAILELETVTIHWWSFGKKKLDYEGNVAGLMKMRDIKIRRITHPKDKTRKGYRCSIALSTRNIKVDVYTQNPAEAVVEVYKLFLALMNDKARLDYRGQKPFTINF